MKEKDITEKTLEAYNDVFADIVNGLLFAGTRVLRAELLTDAQPVSVYKTDGKLHEQERDISKYWLKSPENRVNIRLAFVGLENQTQYDKDMPLRVIGYDGAAYRAQLSSGGMRYPVITLVLYFGDKPWGTNRSLHDAVRISERLKPYVSDYRINIFEIARLPKEAVSRFQSDFRVVADYFTGKRSNPDYRPENPVEFQHTDELLKLMTVLTKDQRFAECLNDEGGKPKNMCEVLDRAEQRGEIIGVVKTYWKIGRKPSEIVTILMDDYSLNRDRAEKVVAETLGRQLL